MDKKELQGATRPSFQAVPNSLWLLQRSISFLTHVYLVVANDCFPIQSVQLLNDGQMSK